MHKRKKLTLLSLGLTFGLVALTSCSISDFPASNAFYINDQASGLLTSTEALIYGESLDLYENVSQRQQYKDAQINGTQIVVATYLGDDSQINSTDVFNEWGIGDNNMGLLLLLYFSPNPDDQYMPIYTKMTREIGRQMAGYISMIRLEQIFMATWESSSLPAIHQNDHDYKLALFYTAVVAEVYERVYGLTYARDSLMDDYVDRQYDDFYNAIPRGNVSALKIAWWLWLVIGLALLLLLGTGRFGFVLLAMLGSGGSKGGGGKSGGYKYTR